MVECSTLSKRSVLGIAWRPVYPWRCTWHNGRVSSARLPYATLGCMAGALALAVLPERTYSEFQLNFKIRVVMIIFSVY